MVQIGEKIKCIENVEDVNNICQPLMMMFVQNVEKKNIKGIMENNESTTNRNNKPLHN